MILVIFIVLLSKGQSYNDLDETSYIYICQNCTEDLIIKSSPYSGYTWYLYSENEAKITIIDYDGYFLTINSTGYQLFQAYCPESTQVGEVIDLTLILKKPWEEDPTIINFITVEVIRT